MCLLGLIGEVIPPFCKGVRSSKRYAAMASFCFGVRDPKLLVPDASSGGGPLTYTVSDLTARKRLIDFFVGRGVQGNARMAASMVEIKEVP